MVLDLAFGVIAVYLLIQQQFFDLYLVVPAGYFFLECFFVGVVVDDAVDVVEMAVDGLELGLEVGEEGVVVYGVLAGLLVLDGALEVVVEVYFAVGEGDLVSDAHLVELLVLGVEVVLLYEVVELQGLFFDVGLEGCQLQLFVR